MKCDSQKKWFTGVEVTITNEVWFSGKVIHVAITLTNEVWDSQEKWFIGVYIVH